MQVRNPTPTTVGFDRLARYNRLLNVKHKVPNQRVLQSFNPLIIFQTNRCYIIAIQLNGIFRQFHHANDPHSWVQDRHKCNCNRPYFLICCSNSQSLIYWSPEFYSIKIRHVLWLQLDTLDLNAEWSGRTFIKISFVIAESINICTYALYKQNGKLIYKQINKQASLLPW